MGKSRIYLASPIIAIDINIQPRGDPNSINPQNRGKIPVAIFSTRDFNAPEMVDRDSLTFGATGEEASLASCSDTPEDVNGDSLMDVVCFFFTGETGFGPGDTEGILQGKRTDGWPMEGRDSVNIVSRK